MVAKFQISFSFNSDIYHADTLTMRKIWSADVYDLILLLLGCERNVKRFPLELYVFDICRRKHLIVFVARM